MSAPAAVARRTARRRGPARPRLLLPPVPEPDLRPEIAAAVVHVPPVLRSVRHSPTESVWPFPTAVPAPAPTDDDPVPSPVRLCASVVVAAVEVLAGTRPLAQLLRWVSPQVHDALALRVQQPTAGPLRRATVRRLRVCRVDEHVAEASVVVHDGVRVRAAAVRLEFRRGQWRATVLQIG